MDDTDFMRTSPRVSDPDLGTPLQVMLQLWQLPLAVYTSWWSSGAAPIVAHPQRTAHAHHEAHDQLVVPETIEVDGEHALFA